MFLAKLVLGFLLAGVTIVRADESIEPADIWDDAEDALQEFIIAVNAALVEADATFDQIAQEVQLLSTDALEQSEDALQVIVDYMDEEVAKIRVLANDQNRESLEKCIIEYTDEMLRVPEYVRELITGCVTGLDTTTSVRLDSARTEAYNYLNIAGDLRADIDGCTVATDARECISRVFVEILLQTIDVPTNIRELARRTQDVLEFYAEEIPFCYRDRISGADAVSIQIVRYIQRCAEVVLNPPESN